MSYFRPWKQSLQTKKSFTIPISISRIFSFSKIRYSFESVNRDCQTLNYNDPWTGLQNDSKRCQSDFDSRWPSGTGSFIFIDGALENDFESHDKRPGMTASISSKLNLVGGGEATRLSDEKKEEKVIPPPKIRCQSWKLPVVESKITLVGKRVAHQ